MLVLLIDADAVSIFLVVVIMRSTWCRRTSCASSQGLSAECDVPLQREHVDNKLIQSLNRQSPELSGLSSGFGLLDFVYIYLSGEYAYTDGGSK